MLDVDVADHQQWQILGRLENGRVRLERADTEVIE
jgi:hypothetical protein